MNATKVLDRFAFPTGHFNKGVTMNGTTLIGSDFSHVYCLEI